MRPAARRHGITDEDIEHATAHAMAIEEQDEDTRLYLGPSRGAELLEVVTIVRDDGSSKENSTVPLTLSKPSSDAVLGTAFVADLATASRSKMGHFPIYQPSTGSRRSPKDSVRLHVRHAASERDGAYWHVHAERRSPHPNCFLNRVRKFDSCRGHYL